MLCWILGVRLKYRKRNYDIPSIIAVDALQTRRMICQAEVVQMCSSEKMATVPSESWRQTSMNNGATEDRRRDIVKHNLEEL